MSWEILQPNNYDIYANTLIARNANVGIITTDSLTANHIECQELFVNGEQFEPVTIATTAEVNTGTSTTTAICPLTASQLGYQSYNKQHGIFYGFSGSYSTGATTINTTNGSQWYTSGITIPSAGILTINSIGKKSTYMMYASIQSSLTTSGQRFDLKIMNLNPSPIVRSNTYLLTSGSSTTSYTSTLSGIVDVDNDIVDLIISIQNININGGSPIVLGNTVMTITEL